MLQLAVTTRSEFAIWDYLQQVILSSLSVQSWVYWVRCGGHPDWVHAPNELVQKQLEEANMRYKELYKQHEKYKELWMQQKQFMEQRIMTMYPYFEHMLKGSSSSGGTTSTNSTTFATFASTSTTSIFSTTPHPQRLGWYFRY